VDDINNKTVRNGYGVSCGLTTLPIVISLLLLLLLPWIDRKIEFPLPDTKTKRHIFNIHTSKMTLSDDVDLEKFVMAKDELSGADIKAICSEAGMLALRERRMKVCQDDFVKAKEKALYRKKGNIPEGLYL
jgi:26S proteasome regulatory subunit T2